MGIILELCTQFDVYRVRFTLPLSPSLSSAPFINMTTFYRIMIGFSRVLTHSSQAARLIAFHHRDLHEKVLKEPGLFI
jgi:hypothetical protein